jgi:tetratricopeptide (TPR) repeat protein
VNGLLEYLYGTVLKVSESIHASLLPAAAGGGFTDSVMLRSVMVGLAAFLVVMLLARLRHRQAQPEAAELRERLRSTELRLESALLDLAAANAARLKLEQSDPESLIRALAVAAQERQAGRALPPEAWLDPLRPVLADAYLRHAREILAKAKGGGDLGRARVMAWGALAAEPERGECKELLARIDEAETMRLFDGVSEADALAWRILRLEAEAQEAAEAGGLKRRSESRIGRELFLAGWEVEDLRAAARDELGARAEAPGVAESVAEAEAAQPEQARRRSAGGSGAGAASRSVPGRVGRGASASGAAERAAVRVVSRNGGRLVAADDAEAAGDAGEGGEAFVAGAGRNTVVMMPATRGGGVARRGGSADDAFAAAEEGADAAESASATAREAALRRLWERRRRPDILGESHPRTLSARANIAHELGRQGRHAEAEAILREVIEALPGEGEADADATDVLTLRHNLGIELFRQARLDEAEAELQAVLAALAGRASGAAAGKHPLSLAAAHGLAEVWAARGEHAEAEQAFAAVWKARAEDPGFGPDHPQTLWSRVRMLRAAEAQAAAGG